MFDPLALRRLASRAAANLVAVAAISAIFGLKTYMSHYALGPAPIDNARHAASIPMAHDVYRIDAD